MAGEKDLREGDAFDITDDVLEIPASSRNAAWTEPETVLEITAESLDGNYGKRTAPTFDVEAGGKLFNGFFVGVAASCLAAFGLQVANGLFRLDGPDPSNFTFRYSNWGESGNLFGIVTGAFLHGSVDHILGNLVFLFPLALVSHRLFGTAKSWALYLGFAVFSWLGTHFFKTVPSIGASWAVFGMFGLVTVVFVRRRSEFSENLRDAAWVLPVVAAYQIFLGFVNPMVDNTAHVTGFMAGIVAGFFLTESMGPLEKSCAEKGRD